MISRTTSRWSTMYALAFTLTPPSFSCESPPQQLWVLRPRFKHMLTDIPVLPPSRARAEHRLCGRAHDPSSIPRLRSPPASVPRPGLPPPCQAHHAKMVNYSRAPGSSRGLLHPGSHADASAASAAGERDGRHTTPDPGLVPQPPPACPSCRPRRGGRGGRRGETIRQNRAVRSSGPRVRARSQEAEHRRGAREKPQSPTPISAENQRAGFPIAPQHKPPLASKFDGFANNGMAAANATLHMQSMARAGMVGGMVPGGMPAPGFVPGFAPGFGGLAPVPELGSEIDAAKNFSVAPGMGSMGGAPFFPNAPQHMHPSLSGYQHYMSQSRVAPMMPVSYVNQLGCAPAVSSAPPQTNPTCQATMPTSGECPPVARNHSMILDQNSTSGAGSGVALQPFKPSTAPTSPRSEAPSSPSRESMAAESATTEPSPRPMSDRSASPAFSCTSSAASGNALAAAELPSSRAPRAATSTTRRRLCGRRR